MRWLNFAMRTAVVVSALNGSVGAQCPISVRGMLDDYPAIATNPQGLYGMSSAVVDTADGRQALVFGGASRVKPSATEYLFGLITWDGRRSGRVSESATGGFTSSWYSTGFDPNHGRFWMSNGGAGRQLVTPNWQTAVPNPLGSFVKQFATWSGHLYACGEGTTDRPSPVTRLDGDTWVDLPVPPLLNGEQAYSRAMGVHDGKLIVAFPYTLKAWDGAAWTNLSPLPPLHTVTAIASYQGKLWTGGAGDSGTLSGDVGRVFRREGTAWIEVARPVAFGSRINDLHVVNGDLYVSGDFYAGGTGLCVLKWNGSGWEAPGTGVAGTAPTLGVWDGRIVAASFGLMRDANVRRLIEFDGDRWIRSDTPGVNDSATPVPGFFLKLGGERVSGGYYRPETNGPIYRVARYDGTRWVGMNAPFDTTPLAMCEWGGGLAAAVTDPADSKGVVVYSLSSSSASWVQVAKARAPSDRTGGIVTGLTAHGLELVVTGAFESIDAGGAAVAAAGCAAIGPEGVRPMPCVGALWITSPLSHDGALHALAIVKQRAAETSFSSTSRVVRWSATAGRWEQLGPDLPNSARQVFFVGTAPAVAYTDGTSTGSGTNPNFVLLAEGQWRNPLGAVNVGRVTPVDSRTVAVTGGPWHTAVQLLRFTFSADIAGGKDDNGDGVVDSADFARFADWMMTGDLQADLGSVGGTPVGDDVLDGNDWQVFFDMYFGGCQQ